MESAPPDATASMTSLHLRFGWWSLLTFLSLGVVLEALHGFKVGWYLDVSNETRRFMWTLAHAHGTLLSLVHLAFAATVWLVPGWKTGSRRLASRGLCGAGVLMPAGFFLGGVQIHAGDPSVGILLLPAGAFLLIVSVFLTALNMSAARSG
jgi:hypothetical protein